jgi:hypothetical protein
MDREEAPEATHLGRKTQGAQRLVEMSSQRGQIQDHQRLRAPAQRGLQQVRELQQHVNYIPNHTAPHAISRTFEFRYGICLSPWPGGAFPKAAITSPNALKLRLILCVSLSRSLSLPAPLEFSRSDPARSTRLSEPSHVSLVSGFEPLMRSVKTECEREERSFMSVAATVRRDCARKSSERTCEGDSRGTAVCMR